MPKMPDLTDEQLDAMDPHDRIQYFKRLGFSHNDACYIGHATNPLRRKWEIRIAIGEYAARRGVDPNELTKLDDGAREDAQRQARDRE